MDGDYLCEAKLMKEAPELHENLTNCIIVMNSALGNYTALFPEFTDHSILHAHEVLEFCNKLIGRNNIDRLNRDEIYILMAGAYFHDIGMALTAGDYHELKSRVDMSAFEEQFPAALLSETVREFHNDLSGEYIKKYAQFYELPSAEHTYAIAQVARGHRRTDLMDPEAYPADYRVPGGSTVCLPYLAVLLRLADELDAAHDRISHLKKPEEIESERCRMCYQMHEATRKVEVLEDRFAVYVSTDDEQVYGYLCDRHREMEEKLAYCLRVIDERTPFIMNQRRIKLIRE